MRKKEAKFLTNITKSGNQYNCLNFLKKIEKFWYSYKNSFAFDMILVENNNLIILWYFFLAKNIIGQ